MLYNIRVITNANRNRVVKETNRLKVYLTASPVEGKANKALIELLVGELGVRRRKIRIVKGQKGRDKIVEVLK